MKDIQTIEELLKKEGLVVYIDGDKNKAVIRGSLNQVVQVIRQHEILVKNAALEAAVITMITKTHKIVILPVTPEDWEHTKDQICKFDYGLNTAGVDNIGYPVQHLYILSDEPIKEGYVYNNKKISHTNKHLPLHYLYELGFRNVLATTDKSLVIESEYQIEQHSKYNLPQIPEQFIKEYVEAFNAGNPITEVQVEYEERKICKYNIPECQCTIPDCKIKSVLKVDSNNCISIFPKQQKLYTRKDLIFYENTNQFNNLPDTEIEKLADEISSANILLFHDGRNKSNHEIKYFQNGVDNIKVNKDKIKAIVELFFKAAKEKLTDEGKLICTIKGTTDKNSFYHILEIIDQMKVRGYYFEKHERTDNADDTITIDYTLIKQTKTE